MLTRAQFGHVVGADEKWVENTARTLDRRLDYTPMEARWLGIVRILMRDFAITATRAAELADEVLRHPPATRSLQLPGDADGVAVLSLDLARFNSSFAAALSAALHHGGPRRRGRPSNRGRPGKRDAVAAAERHGVDVSLLRTALAKSPSERLATLDANAAFLAAIRPVRDAVRQAPQKRRDRRS